jgi:hypothetical protein
VWCPEASSRGQAAEETRGPQSGRTQEGGNGPDKLSAQRLWLRLGENKFYSGSVLEPYFIRRRLRNKLELIIVDRALFDRAR